MRTQSLSMHVRGPTVLRGVDKAADIDRLRDRSTAPTRTGSTA